MNKNKYVIYTSLTGGYDKLPQYEVLDDRFDYICFSNDYPDGSKVGQWEIRKIPIREKSNIILSRFPKLQPHKILSEYEYSIWLDSNIIIIGDAFYNNILKKISIGGEWYGIAHPLRNCIYDEIIACREAGIIGYFKAKRLLKILLYEGFPKNYGLYENNLILRRHNTKIIIKIDDIWWTSFVDSIKRDQISLFFIFWKLNFRPQILQKNSTRNDDNLRYLRHISNKKYRIKKLCMRILNSISRKLDFLSDLEENIKNKY